MTVIEQLTSYCDCLDNVDERDIDELITLISVYTCWTGKVCDTFLSAERKEVIDLPDCVCECDVFTFEPFYVPFDKDSFTFTLIEQTGIEETATEITEYVYSEADENFRIALPLDNCQCQYVCGCKPNYKLLVTYTAGYELIPDCLLPIFCEALQWIKDKNTCECCNKCDPCEDSTERKYYEIDYTTLTGRMQDYFLNMLTVQYMRELSLISLCDRNRYKLWSVVV